MKLFLAGFLLASFFSSVATASVELDRRYALETVGFLRAWDNVDGLFANYVSDAYKDYFSRQSRFVLQDLSQADVVLSKANLPYRKLIDDPEILAKIARTTRSETMIRTKVTKEGPQYRFQIEWMHAPEMDILAKQEMMLEDPRDGNGFGAQELKGKIEDALDKTIHGIPFAGAVTGRDNESVTLNIGGSSGILPGDELVIGTLEEVKRHPLLKQVVEWRFAKTGRVRVEQVEEKLSFGKVMEDDSEHPIARQQKIMEIIHRPESRQLPADVEKEKPADLSRERPTLGWVSLGPALGGFSRDYSSLNNTIGQTGGGFFAGVKADGQLWLTREWFTELAFDVGYFGYSQQSTLAGASTASNNLGSGNLVSFNLAGGYSYLLNGDLFGPKGWLKVGYRSNAYSLPTSATDGVAPINFSSVYAGLGAEVPVRNEFGGLMDIGIGIFKSASEDTHLSGNAQSVSDVSFKIGGYYRYLPRVTIRATIDVLIDSADFSSQRSVNQKVVTFVPSLLYYF